MPSGDSRAVELGRMKNKMVEAEASLKEERKAIARLQDQNEKRYQQIVDVEADIAAEEERFRWAKEELVFQIRTAKSQSSLSVDAMKMEEKALLEEISEFAVLQYENEQLHLKLKMLSLEHKQMSQQQNEERELKKQKDFDLRMAMDEIFRKTLKSVDENYEKQAIAKMRFEASQANAENDDIYREFDLREKKTETLIRQQQQSFDQLMKIRIEKDVLNMSIAIQEKNVRKFRRQTKENEIEVRELLSKVQRWRDEVEALTETVAKKTTLINQCEAVRNQVAAVAEEKKILKKNTIKLCQALISKTLRISAKATTSQSAQLTQQMEGLEISHSTPIDHFPDTIPPQDEEYFRDISQQPHTWDPDSVWRTSESSIHLSANERRRKPIQMQSFSLL